jgi:hypothetical protein
MSCSTASPASDRATSVRCPVVTGLYRSQVELAAGVRSPDGFPASAQPILALLCRRPLIVRQVYPGSGRTCRGAIDPIRTSAAGACCDAGYPQSDKSLQQTYWRLVSRFSAVVAGEKARSLTSWSSGMLSRSVRSLTHRRSPHVILYRWVRNR